MHTCNAPLKIPVMAGTFQNPVAVFMLSDFSVFNVENVQFPERAEVYTTGEV